MTALRRQFVILVAATAAIALAATVIGVLVAAFASGPSYGSAIAWSMWIVGSLVVLVVAQSGSTSRMAGESRIVVGGRFAPGSDIPMPRSPFVFVPAGFAVVAVGILVYVYWR
jgi:hypothetical protein